MDKKEHPRGLPPKERQEFHDLMKQVMAYYKNMPFDEDPDKFRKIVAGWDEEDPNNLCILMRGDKRELEMIIKFIKNIL